MSEAVTAENYSSLAMRTENVPTGNMTISHTLKAPLFGAFAAGAALGSAVDDLKRAIFYGALKDPVAIMQKLGDVGFEMKPGDLVLSVEQYRMLHSALGVVTEAMEFLETISENLKDGVPFDSVHIMEEGGDLQWYLAIPRNMFGYTLPQEMQANIDKLRKRYPLKFDAEKALNRELTAERQALEQAVTPAPPAL